MLVHNYYSDLLSSLTYFLNNFILNDHHIKIQNFQFNIGNSSFQLNYNTQFDLPSAIITLQSPIPYSNHPYTFHRNIVNNINKISVLYDRTKNLELFLQEELYTVPVTVNINCDSQLQALEIQHRIQNYIPINKYLHTHEYTSFFEIDSNLLSKYLFDVNKDKIDNLFYKQNKYTDSFDYCFSVSYEPLTRLNSCDVGIDSSVNSSFQVACSFEFLNHVPIYLIPPRINWNNMVTSNYLKYNNIPVPVHEDKDFLLVELANKDDNSTHFELWQLNNGMVEGEFKYNKKIFSAITLIDTVKYSALLHITELLDSEIVNSQCLIEGDRINGTLRQIKIISSDKLTAYFVGIVNNKHHVDYLEFEYELIKSQKTVDNLIFLDQSTYNVLTYTILPNQINVLNSIKNVNKSAIKLNTYYTTIIKYVNVLNQEIIFDEPIFINQYTNDFTLPNGITGHLDADTFELYLYTDDHDILYLYFNLSFDFVKGIPTTIERINYNFNANEQVIVNTSPHSTLRNFAELTSAIISDIKFDDVKNQISFNMKDMGVNVQNLSKLSFKFITLNQEIVDNNYLNIDFENSTIDKLTFQLINSKVYWKFFSTVNTLNPIYFCYSLEER